MVLEGSKMILVNEHEFYHLLRAVRERLTMFKKQLAKGEKVDPVKVAVTIGNDEALKMLGYHSCVDTLDLQKWLYKGSDYTQIKKGESISAI